MSSYTLQVAIDIDSGSSSRSSGEAAGGVQNGHGVNGAATGAGAKDVEMATVSEDNSLRKRRGAKEAGGRVTPFGPLMSSCTEQYHGRTWSH